MDAPASDAAPLELLWHDDTGLRRLALAPDRPVVLGRDPGCDIVFGSLAVSRRHASIEADGGRFVVRPLSRTSPTRLNGRVVVRAAPLAAGDTLQLAMVQLAVVDAPGAGAAGERGAQGGDPAGGGR